MLKSFTFFNVSFISSIPLGSELFNLNILDIFISFGFILSLTIFIRELSNLLSNFNGFSIVSFFINSWKHSFRLPNSSTILFPILEYISLMSMLFCLPFLTTNLCGSFLYLHSIFYTQFFYLLLQNPLYSLSFLEKFLKYGLSLPCFHIHLDQQIQNLAVFF